MEDINQLLAYHEVFGKLQNEMAVAAGTATAGAVLQSPGGVKSSCSEVGGAGGSNTATVSTATSPTATAVITAAGTHICDICSKIFPFRYQLIVHRRYHTERKPFTCQVCMSYTNVRKYGISLLLSITCLCGCSKFSVYSRIPVVGANEGSSSKCFVWCTCKTPPFTLHFFYMQLLLILSNGL